MVEMPGPARIMEKTISPGTIFLFNQYFDETASYRDNQLLSSLLIMNIENDSMMLPSLNNIEILVTRNLKCWQILNMGLLNMNINEALTTPELEWLH